jgi:hypothetical protein
MSVEFVRNPKNPGLNNSSEGKIFQSVLCQIGFECYLTIDIDKNGKVVNEFYTREQSPDSTEDIEWYT